jgi:hypothetical protein
MGRTRPGAVANGHFALVRNAWRALLALTLGLFAFSIPARYGELEAVARAPERTDGRALGGLLEAASSPDVYPLLVTGIEVSFVVALLVVGLAIAWAKAGNWRNLFFSAVFITYAVWVTPTLDALTGDPALKHLVSMVQAVGLIFAIHFFLLFPDGRFTPRWTRVSSVFWIAYTLAWGISPDAWFSLLDPFDVPFVIFATLMFGWVTGLVAQAARYRSDSTPQQRRQTRWVILAVAGAVASYGAVYLPGVFIAERGVVRVAYELFSVPVFWLLAMPMAFALGISMLRHQLFDFHTAIRRTLVYGSLTATLACAYLGMVTLLGRVLHPITGTSDLAVAASTLTVAGLFTPARGRIQQVIDRRFYRNRYDADKAVDRFTMYLRDQVELASLERELIDVVHETMHPTAVSLSLIGSAASPDNEGSVGSSSSVRSSAARETPGIDAGLQVTARPVARASRDNPATARA